jgi:hypothetical protein
MNVKTMNDIEELLRVALTTPRQNLGEALKPMESRLRKEISESFIENVWLSANPVQRLDFLKVLASHTCLACGHLNPTQHPDCACKEGK